MSAGVLGARATSINGPTIAYVPDSDTCRRKHVDDKEPMIIAAYDGWARHANNRHERRVAASKARRR